MGYAEDWVEPDIAVWRISIQQRGENLKELKAENDQQLESLLSASRSLGVKEENFVSGRIDVSKMYKTDKNGSSTGDFSHFVLSRDVQVEQYDLGKFDEFLDKLLLGSGLDVRLQYRYTKADSVRNDLQLKAMRVAREKAVEMAEIVNATISRPLVISEFPIISDYQTMDQLALQAGVISSPSPQRIHIAQKVFVRFQLGEGENAQ